MKDERTLFVQSDIFCSLLLLPSSFHLVARRASEGMRCKSVRKDYHLIALSLASLLTTDY